MTNLEKNNYRQCFSGEKKRLPELLAPVASFEMLKAAVHNGSDAVYIGMPRHNARARTEDLSWELLDEMIHYAHSHDVKVLIAFNILVFEDELKELEHDIHDLVKLHPDAIIVQDLGLCYLLQQMYPELPLHASTQMTHTNSLGIELLKDLNLKRVVLGREVTLNEMRLIKSQTDVELEVFVHGALCVAYSGQCLTSESFGGRSANRGQCAQSCRLDYQLIVDGTQKPMHGIQNLVSPKDLCGLDDLPSLIEIGINSLKIEGRYKSPEYVGMTSRMYRQQLDDASLRQSTTDLEIMFSRGFYSGWYHGVHHENLVDGKNSSHRGACVGFVSQVNHSPNPSLNIQTHNEIYHGDGILIVNESGRQSASGKAYHVKRIHSNEVKVEFSNAVSFNKTKPGDQVFINSSDYRNREIGQSWKNKQNHKKTPVSCFYIGKLNRPLELNIECGAVKLKLFSEDELQLAKSHPLGKEDLFAEFKKLGGTVYELQEFDGELEGQLFLTAKNLKQLRQTMIRSLDQQRCDHAVYQLHKPFSEVLRTSKSASVTSNISLHVLVREPEQLNLLNPSLVQKITLDYKHGTPYGPSIKRIKAMGCKAGIATTRILKEKQLRRLNDLAKLQPDHLLVRNLGALYFIQQHPELAHISKTGDFSLNVTNHLSSFYLLGKGLDLICPSYDLNRQQLMSLLQQCTPNRYEVTVHQYMPSFHMEHCVFATFLSDGTNARNCGMVCRDHQVSLKDPKGFEHPLQADQECRNTMFNGIAQSAANLIPDLLETGVRNFRIEALMETSEEIVHKLEMYKNVMEGKISPDAIKTELGLDEKYGISEGQLLNNRVYKDRKKST